MFGIFKKKEPFKQEVEAYLKQVGGIDKAYDVGFHSENLDAFSKGFELALACSVGMLVDDKQMGTPENAMEFLKYVPSNTEDNALKNQLFNKHISFVGLQLMKDGMGNGPYTLRHLPDLADVDRYDPRRMSFVAGINALKIIGALYHKDNSSVTPLLDEMLDGGMVIKDDILEDCL